MSVTLGDKIPHGADDDRILERFLEYVDEIGLTLYPAQEQALLELASGKNLILNTPTGSGKSLVASFVHFRALAKGQRSVYTSPIKALASEKFFALSRELGPEYVGMLTGDASVNRDAPVLCCTAEIVANMALRQGADADIDHLVMDEFHYYSDPERGVAWQIPLLLLRRARFTLMSATLGDTRFFEERLSALTGVETAAVLSKDRPVPLDFTYRETPLHETVEDLLSSERAPIYIVNFTQRGAAEEAQNLMSVDFSSKEQKAAIKAALVGVRFESPYGKEMMRFLRHGIGLHHAGLLPKYRLAVEKLAQKGHLKIISGTDTLGVGVNIPIRTVLFTKLCKFDGQKTAICTVRDFQQISGRAGRKGFDDRGSVAVQAPVHVIENLRLEAKAAANPAKKRKLVKKKPPDRGYVHWDRSVFERLVSAPPEPLISRFKVSHGMLINLLDRETGGCMAMARLIRDCHDRKAEKRVHGRTALQMFQSLLDAGIVEKVASGAGHRAQISESLQQDFSLNQALSLYLLETIGRLDIESESYALDLLTLVESILENPAVILRKQLDLIKTLKMSEMKAAGVEYDERIKKLDELDYPRPNADFIYETFNAFAKQHPWMEQENIRPKSIARDMVEKFLSFSDYVKEYGLERSEGLLLRYLSEVYKVLVQTVPDGDKTADVDELVTFFGAMVRQVDSSLLDEWEQMRSGVEDVAPHTRSEDLEPEGSRDVTRDERGFTVLVRNALFQLLKALAARDVAAALDCTQADAQGALGRTEIESALEEFFAAHAALRTDPEARRPSFLTLEKSEWHWEWAQVLLDPEEENDWVMSGSIDVEASRSAGRPILLLRRIGS